MTVSINNDLETLSVTLPDTNFPSDMPKGWALADGMGALTLVGPERDLEMTFVATTKKGDAEVIASAAWCRRRASAA